MPQPPYRDAVASRKLAREIAAARPLRVRRAMASSTGTAPVVRRPPDQGGHLLVARRDAWLCEVCRHFGAWKALAPQRCPGPALRRWATTAARRLTSRRISASLRQLPVPDARAHHMRCTGILHWCATCGAYAQDRAVLIAQPCPGPPRLGLFGGRGQQLRRLRASRHPRTGEHLLHAGRDEAAVPSMPAKRRRQWRQRRHQAWQQRQWRVY